VTILRPERDRHVAIEGCAKLAERLAAIGSSPEIDAAVRHAVLLEIVGRGEGDRLAVGREAHRRFADFFVVGQPFDLAGRDLEQIQIRVESFLRDVALVAIAGAAADGDPLAVLGDREVVDVVGGVRRQRRGLLRLEIERPEAGERRFGVADVDGELLLPPQLLIRIGCIRRNEIDARAVGRKLPVVDTGGLFRNLLGRGLAGRYTGSGRRERGDRKFVELFFASFSRTVDDPAAVTADGEVRHAFFRIGEAPCLAAVGAHHVELIAPRFVLRPFWRVAVREEEERLAVTQPGGRRLVLRFRERHLPRRGDALRHGDEEQVGRFGPFVPIRNGHRVDQPLPIRTRRRRRGLPHQLHVEKGHGALLRADALRATVLRLDRRRRHARACCYRRREQSDARDAATPRSFWITHGRLRLSTEGWRRECIRETTFSGYFRIGPF
jgi:hypothetical protein